MSSVTNLIKSGIGVNSAGSSVSAEPVNPGVGSRSLAEKAGEMSAVVVREIAELEKHVAAWEELAAASLEPNVFYEPWVLVEAFRALGRGCDVRFVLLFAPNPSWQLGPPVLCGVFPLEFSHWYKGLPVRNLRLWKHKYCPLCTPLIRGDRARECLAAFFEWLATADHGCSLMEFRFIPGDGIFHQLLVDYLDQHATLSFVEGTFTRALFRRSADADSYIRAALSTKHRKAMQRNERRLSESGALEYLELEPEGDARTWIDEFITLEASGWKGEKGTALASRAADREFFEKILMDAFRRGRLMMLALRHNGRAIAFKCTFLAANGAFASKIAFDESYASFSPGMLLELETIRRVHARPGIDWMDSCTVAGSSMFNRIWLRRRIIQSVVVGTGKGAGDFVVSLLPLLKWFKRSLLSVLLFGRHPARPPDSRSDLG